MSDYNSSLPVRSEADVDERLQSKIVDFTNPAQGAEVDADSRLHTKAHLSDENGDAYSSSNPLAVEFFETDDEIYDYDAASGVAKNATSNHDYTTTAAFKLKSLILSSSGFSKFEVQIETGAATETFNTVAVAFNSTATPTKELHFQKGLNVLSGAIVRVIRTNLDNQPNSLYSTIVGINP